MQLLLLVVVVAHIAVSQRQIEDLQFENVVLRNTCENQKKQYGGTSGVNKLFADLVKQTDSNNETHGRIRRQVNDSSYLDRKELMKLLFPGLESRLDSIEQRIGDGNFNKQFNKQFDKQLRSKFVKMLNETISAKSSLVCGAIRKTCIKGIAISETFSSTKQIPKDLTGVVLQGPPGPPGPAGKPGVQGPRGFGIYKTKIVSSSLSTSANQSSSVPLTCTAFGNPLPKFNWTSNARNFTVSSIANNDTNEITSTLHITDIGWNDRGRVQCHAKNYFGEDKREGTLAVFASPIIHLSSAVASANIGSVAMLPPCNVTSEPKAKITWRKGFGELKSGSKVINDSLIIPNIDWLDTGYYVCEAENHLGKTSAQVLLRTHQFHFREIPSTNKQTNNVSCSAAGPAKYGSQMKATWRRKGSQPLQSPENVMVVRDDNFIQATLTGYQFFLDTQYECKITDGKLSIDYTFTSSMSTCEYGQGTGGYNESAGYVNSIQECYKSCLAKKKTNPTRYHKAMNGFTYNKSPQYHGRRKVCNCRYGMSGRTDRSSKAKRSCYF